MDAMDIKPKRNIWILFVIVVGGLLVGGGVLFGCGAAGYLIGRLSNSGDSPSMTQPPGPVVGELAPDFELTNLDGSSVRLSDFQGQPVLLNFWASWCGPCVMEMDLIQEQQDTFSSELVILAVDVDDSASTAREFADEESLTFTILLDTAGDVQSQYRVSAIPVSYFIDEQGIIQAVHLGGLDEKLMDRYLLLLGVGE